MQQLHPLSRRRSTIPWGIVGPLRMIVLAIHLFAMGVPAVSACTIPVFRYALERWESDRLQVIVYYEGRLTEQQETALSGLERRSVVATGPLNIEVIRYDLRASSGPKLLEAERPSSDRPLPWVEVRARVDWTRFERRWEGTFAEAIENPELFESPARSEIVRRILDGHSSVWLLVAPSDQIQTLSEQLQGGLNDVAQQLSLPEGIGLPGSELYASVPLEMRFSVLSIAHGDPAEQQFLKMLAASAGEWRTDAAYVIPVFGRGRALDVFPHAELDTPLIEQVAGFICGACSCQVKQANPGFDLLVSVDWNERLFGSSAAQHAVAPPPKDADPGRDAGGSPEPLEYVSIPEGNETDQKAAQTTNADPALAPGVPKPHAPPRSNEGDYTTPATSSGESPANVILLIAAAVAAAGAGIALVIALAKR